MTTKCATYDEASEAAQRLGLKTRPEYRKGYSQDPKLPSDPDTFYAEDWVDWYDFLGNDRPEKKYATLAEASEAAQRLGITTSTEYNKRYSEDPKLSRNPKKPYAEDWVSWYDFLGNDRPEEKYATYAKASEAAQRLGFATKPEYIKGYSQDPKLSSDPETFYAEEWVDWYDFLGNDRPKKKYATYAKASEAAQRLGLKTLPEYTKGYSQDPKLPASPHQTYAAEWVDWYDFLGNDRPEQKYATLAAASEAAQRLGLKTLPEYKKCY